LGYSPLFTQGKWLFFVILAAMISKRHFSVLLISLLSIHMCLGQDLTGIWRGYFFTANHDNYKFEIQIKQSGQSISGVSYSYLTTQFYGKASLAGVFTDKTDKVKLQEIKTLEVKNSDGSGVCIMNCQLTYSKSGREEYLEGSYGSIFEKTDKENKAGEDCGSGTVFLRRVKESDFYQESFLSNNAENKRVIVNQAPSQQKTVTGSPIKKKLNSQETTSLVPQSNFVQGQSIEQPQGKTINSDKSISAPIAKKEIAPVSNNRINQVVRELTLPNKDVHISIYDNGEIDGDSITVYINNKVVIYKKMLTASPIEFNVHLSGVDDLAEITLVADNLGRIPPNTSLMIVESGGKRIDVIRISSSEQNNAVVRLKLDTQTD
jgi:hypothetical protein